MAAKLPGRFGHESWLTALGTVFGYGVILVVMTLVLFALPYLLFLVL